jgi:hypothetical protein
MVKAPRYYLWISPDNQTLVYRNVDNLKRYIQTNYSTDELEDVSQTVYEVTKRYDIAYAKLELEEDYYLNELVEDYYDD